MPRPSVIRPALALGVGAMLVVAPSALGAISGTVFRDYNSNGAKDAGAFVSGSSMTRTDPGVGGVVVRAFDSAGAPVGEATTADDGSYRLSTSVSGTVRVEFGTPTGFEPSFAGATGSVVSGTSVQFVKPDATGVNYGVAKPGEYCQDNPRIVTCLQPSSNQMVDNPGTRGVIGTPAAFSFAQNFTPNALAFESDQDPLTNMTQVSNIESLGATFGVGIDRLGNAYLGTYVKRHSPYGPAGATNAIYKVDLATGATSTFVDLGGSLPAHDAASPNGYPPYAMDGQRRFGDTNDVYHQVGRAGLGDVDVSPDGSTLYAVEMTQAAPRLWTVPIVASGSSVTAGAPTSISIPAPATFNGVDCIGTWHPMGIGIRDDTILVGGVCGGDESKFVANPSDTSLSSRTQAAAFVLRLNPARTGFTTVAALDLGYNRAQGYLSGVMGAWNTALSGFWHNWSDAAPPAAVINNYAGFGKPMLANIEIADNGDLVLGIRDRFQDQVKPSAAVNYEWNGTGTPSQQGGFGVGDIVRLCNDGGSYSMEYNGACANGAAGANLEYFLQGVPGRETSPLFYANAWVNTTTGPPPPSPTPTPYQNVAAHPYTGLGGLAMLPGAPYLWATRYDPSWYGQQGLSALGPCAARADVGTCGPAGAPDGAVIGGAISVPNTAPPSLTFAKGNGMGDLEIACNSAPVQIGNRVWIDTNRNGIQDPDEKPVAGVTVRLYSAGGTLVGTAITDSEGRYYFSSDVTKPAAGDGTHIGGGLVQGAAFTVRLDNPADYAAGGPLASYVLTKADAVAGNGANSTAINSKALKAGTYPQIDIPARRAGFNDHTFDAGFVTAGSGTQVLVAIGNFVWFDANRNGVQDRRERPVKGARVILLRPSGARARMANGRVAPVRTTNARGRYLFDGLKPGRYRVRFIFPAGYTGTLTGKGNPRNGSNPKSTKLNNRVAITPAFTVYGSAKGNTVAQSNPKVNAQFIDPTIDAGLIRSVVTSRGVAG